MKDFLKTFDSVWSKRFFSHRNRLALSACDVARKLDADERTIILLEQKPSRVPLNIFYKVCLIYRFSPEDLFELTIMK